MTRGSVFKKLKPEEAKEKVVVVPTRDVPLLYWPSEVFARMKESYKQPAGSGYSPTVRQAELDLDTAERARQVAYRRPEDYNPAAHFLGILKKLSP